MLKLWQQGLILVSIPLVFNLAFTAVLLRSLNVAEQDSFKERNSSDRVSQLTTCCGAAIGATACTLNAITDAERKDQWQSSFEDHFQTLKEHRERLERLLADSPDAGTYRVYLGLIDDFSSQLIKTRQKLGESADLSKLFRVYAANRSVEHRLRSIMYMNRDILRTETKLLESSREQAIEARQNVYVVVWLGLALNIVTATALAALFRQSAALRVKNLIEHTLLIGARKSLPKPMTGGDEFAQIDYALAGMAAALESAAQRERAILENAAEVICSVAEDGRITEISPSCTRIWGYLPAELLGARLLEFVSPETQAATVRELLTDRQPLFNFENCIRSKSGQLVECAWSCSRSQTEKAVFCVVRDITEPKRIEQMKKQFVAMVSHDLRTPLNSISAFLQVLLKGAHGAISETATQGAQLAQNSAERLISLVNELLELEKMQSGKVSLRLEQCSLSDIFADCEASTTSLAEQRKIMVYYQDCSTTICADRERLTQVLVNLVSNAIKYSPRDSVVEVKAQIEPDQFVKISVIDEGRGIPSDELPLLFEPFYQTAQTEAERLGGTGLGLAICKQIVEQHGGTIGATSEINKGSCFWFTVKSNGV
jgi:PAS domain S-box-containing protein